MRVRVAYRKELCRAHSVIHCAGHKEEIDIPRAVVAHRDVRVVLMELLVVGVAGVAWAANPRPTGDEVVPE